MKKDRLIKGNLLLMLLFAIAWYYSVIYKFGYLKGKNSLSRQQFFQFLYGKIESHMGTRVLVFFYSLAFVLIVYYILSEQSEAWIVRHQSRGRIAWKYLGVVTAEALFAAVFCESADFLGMWYFCPKREWLDSVFIYASLGHMACLFLYFVRAGIYLLIFRHIFLPKLTPYLLELGFILEYMYQTQNLGIKLFPNKETLWVPMADTSVKLDLYLQKMSELGLLAVLARDAGMICLAAAAFFWIFNKKDLIVNEKS